MSEKKRIYLDYAATTPVDPDVFEAMRPYFSEKFGNPSSIHQFGQEAQEGIVLARRQVADFLGCDSKEVIFTSGATEGNNTVIKGIGSNRDLTGGSKPHIIVSSIEHDCVLGSAEYLKANDLAEVTFLPANREGLVEIEDLEKSIKENTILVSVMYVNNEVGTVQPVEEIGSLIKKLNESRSKKIYFHTDAAQAINYFDCDVNKLGVDFMTISAHKIYGPKGAGALFVRQGSVFSKLMSGGDQEFRMRAGTHNTPGIVGLGKAIEKVKAEKSRIEKTKNQRDRLIKGILDGISGSALNGSWDKRSPNNANFRFEGVEGESLLISLDMEGVAVSTGSACAARSLSPSHVLLAMGLNHLQSHSSIRFSLGRLTEDSDIEKIIQTMPRIIERLRSISGNLEGGAVERGKLPDDFGC
jgi:cysteine desulfurase